ncbi:hypothetical protein ACFCVO_08850 [Agromyces sp. NPDC056379]|uniref:hypothetical protein n=1 Tax=unclassified Agromyces TaxID=2639701 RepID=UPI0035E12B93
MAERKPTGLRRWMPVVIVVVIAGGLAAIQVVRVADSAQRNGSATLDGVVIALVFTALTVGAVSGWLFLSARSRRVRLAERYPNARQFGFAATAPLVESARILGSRVSPNALGTVVIADGQLLFFAGGAATPRVSVQVQQIAAIEGGESLVGVRWTPAINISVRHEGRDLSLLFVPNSPRGALRLVTKVEVEAIAAQLEEELRAEVLRSSVGLS